MRISRSLLAVAILACQPLPAAGRVIVHAGTLLAVPGEAPRARQSVIVEGGRIAEVRDGFVREEGVQVIDLSRGFVLPGLTDLHTHITGELGPASKLNRVTRTPADLSLDGAKFALRTLQAGFTTIRDLGGVPEAVFALRAAIAAAGVPGPRIVAAGGGVSATGGHGDAHGFVEEVLALLRSSGICDGADDCRRAVRAQVKRGADWIKITATGGVLSETAAGVSQQFFADELEAIVATARQLGRRVAAHAHGADGINAALRAGVASIEHGTFADDTSMRLFRETGAYLVPTMLAGVTVAEMAGDSSFMPPPIRAKAQEVGPRMRETVERAHREGVRIAFGTDSGVSRHGDNAREFALLVAAGLSPMEAIVSATVTAAELLGLADEQGTVEPGKRADLVATGDDPLTDVTALERVTFVMKDGEVYKD